MSVQKFWVDDLSMNFPYGAVMELRTHIAYELVRTHSALPETLTVESQQPAGNESASLKMATNDPVALVDRCFAIADAFVDKAIERGGIRQAIGYEERRIRTLRAEASCSRAAIAEGIIEMTKGSRAQ